MKYDICIIGAGPAGYSGAIIAAREGKKVALVEKDRPGGTCLNRGCIPTKALRQCADALVLARTADHFGVVASRPELDFDLVAGHRDRATEALVSGVLSLIKSRKVALFKGEGRVAGPGRVKVRTEEGEVEITCGQVVIATGSRPCDLPGIRIDEERVISSESATLIRSLPQSAVVIGGGVIGCEFADLLVSFGAEVGVVEAMPRILLNEDRSTARAVQKSLESRGVKFYLGTEVEDLSEAENGVGCTLTGGEKIEAEQVIVSVGRRPRVEGVGLEEVGVSLEGGAIRVDAKGRTSVEGVWAAGDVTGPPMLAHAASHEMEVVIENILGREKEFEREAIPQVTFVRPEVASVGLLEDAAKERGIPVKVGRFSYAASGKAHCTGETEGFAKVVVSEDKGAILGGTVMGAHAGELVHELAVAVKLRLGARDLTGVIHAHPTLSEIILEAAGDALGLAVHKRGRR